jgi:hypothetical protein
MQSFQHLQAITCNFPGFHNKMKLDWGWSGGNRLLTLSLRKDRRKTSLAWVSLTKMKARTKPGQVIESGVGLLLSPPTPPQIWFNVGPNYLRFIKQTCFCHASKESGEQTFPLSPTPTRLNKRGVYRQKPASNPLSLHSKGLLHGRMDGWMNRGI